MLITWIPILDNVPDVFLGEQIKKFMEFYRSTFPDATVLPKMHILEEHVTDWLQRWHLGAGLMGEQGAESLHAHLMRLERTYQGVPNEVQRLKYIFKEHILESAPSLVNLRPPPAKRKKKSSSDTEESDSDEEASGE